eukprot:sb/3477501/
MRVEETPPQGRDRHTSANHRTDLHPELPPPLDTRGWDNAPLEIPGQNCWQCSNALASTFWSYFEHFQHILKLKREKVKHMVLFVTGRESNFSNKRSRVFQLVYIYSL